MDLVDFILRDKRDKQQEYTIHLFEFCNLSCPFCWQDHDNIVGIDTVLDKLESIILLLYNIIKCKKNVEKNK